MPRKPLPYQEGSWFAVPLRDKSGYGLGLVARMNSKGGVLGYFFGKKFTSPPKIADLGQFSVDDSILVRQFGDLGLIKSVWPIIGRLDNWSRDQWPVPAFARIAVDASSAWKVIYSESDGMSLLGEQEVAVWEAKLLPEDGLSGYGAIELRLTQALKEKSNELQL